MYKLIFSLILAINLAISLLVQTSSQTGSAPEIPFQEADGLFTFGADVERDKRSLAALENLTPETGNNYQRLWRVARACYFIGDAVAKTDKLQYFEKGIDSGLRAVGLDSDAADGHYWLAMNYGGFSEQKGGMKAIATAKKIRSEMEIVLQLNDSYQDGGAYLALGELDRQLPRVLGGSIDRSISRLEQGMRVAPQNLEMKFALAQAYQAAGRKEDARREFQAFARIEPRNSAERRLQEKALQHLAKL